MKTGAAMDGAECSGWDAQWRGKNPTSQHCMVRMRQIRIVFSALLAFSLVSASVMRSQDTSTDFDRLASSAAVARQQNDLPHAIDAYRQAVQMNPRWPEGWWYLGMLQYESNDYAAARAALDHFIDLTPDAGPAVAIRGLCEFETADYAASLNDIQRALYQGAADQGAASRQRNAGILHYHEILLLSHAGRFEEALGSAAFFAKGPAASPEIVVAVGMAGLRVSLLPKDVPDEGGQRDLYLAAGNATLSFMVGDKERSGQAFQELFQRFPTAPNAHFLYGYLSFGADPDKAIAEFKRELEVAPSNPVTEAMLGWTFLLQNDFEQARKYGNEAAEQAPQLTMAQLVLGRSLVEAGDVKDGLEHLEKAVSVEPNNTEIHLALVRAYSKLGRRDDAQRERQRCLQLTDGMEMASARP